MTEIVKSMARLYEELREPYFEYVRQVSDESARSPVQLDPLSFCEWMREQGHEINWVAPDLMLGPTNRMHAELLVFGDGSIRYTGGRIHRGDTVIGEPAILRSEESDGKRKRLTTGYVGENGIEADVAYRCDDGGKLVAA